MNVLQGLDLVHIKVLGILSADYSRSSPKQVLFLSLFSCGLGVRPMEGRGRAGHRSPHPPVGDMVASPGAEQRGATSPGVVGATWVPQCPPKHVGRMRTSGLVGDSRASPQGSVWHRRSERWIRTQGTLGLDPAIQNLLVVDVFSSCLKNGLHQLPGGYKEVYLNRSQRFLPNSPELWKLRALGASGTVSGFLMKLQKIFFPGGSVWMAGQMGPEMRLYLKAVLSFNVRT